MKQRSERVVVVGAVAEGLALDDIPPTIGGVK
jgi:hypothetical protein